MPHSARLRFVLILSLLSTALSAAAQASLNVESSKLSGKYLDSVRRFADSVLENGRDKYGAHHGPLFVDGLDVDTLEPVRWKKKGETWVLCDFANQQALMRTLDGFSTLTADKKYRQAAEDATRDALSRLSATNGLLYWGGHMAWDLEAERPVGQYPDIHELKDHEPYFELFWRVDPGKTKRLCGAIWAAHVLDWSLLDYNRHARTETSGEPQWDQSFNENVEVPFPSVKENLSFAMVTPSLMNAGVALATLDNNSNALICTRRLVYRWQQARDPKTGLSGGQLSYRKKDRAQEALGHVYTNINEAKIVASYHQIDRYHHLPLAQMQEGERLLAHGGDCVAVGREFIDWASEDLKVYAKYCYDVKSAHFIALLTDGTPIRWQEAHAGYYNAASFAPAKPDGYILWSYAQAFRLTHDPEHWKMEQNLARALGLGDIGQTPADQPKLALDTVTNDWRFIYALLEMRRATGNQNFTKLACRIADNLLKMQSASGLFPRPGRHFARTGDEIPLALLHLAAALQERDASLPQPVLDNAFFHCEYDGELAPKKPGIEDNRVYDNSLFYGPN